MRYVFRARFVLPIAAALAACAGVPRDGSESAPNQAPPVEAGAAVPPGACGEASDLPARTTRNDAAHTVEATCDGDVKTLALTVLDEGLVRLRYDGASGSVVPVDALLASSPLRTGRRGDAAVVCTPELEITVRPGSCRVSAVDVATGEVVLDDGEGGPFRGRARPIGRDADEDVIGIARVSPEGERFYGLGLHTAAASGIDLRGRVIELYNTDAYDAAAGGFRPDAPHLYESIPFYVGLRKRAAYGVFTDATHRTRFDLASDGAGARVSVFGGALDQYVVPGPAIRDVVRRYTRLTGRAPLPAPWAIGFHQSRWEGPCDGSPEARPFCSASQIVALAQRFRSENVPLDGIFLDIQHMDGFRTFTFDPVRFADAAALADQLDALGVRMEAIIDPGIKIDPAWDVYQQGIGGSHFLKTPAGAVYEGEVWPGPSVFPDFSAPKTRAWWAELVKGFASRGVRGAWIDMNEPASFVGGTVPDDLPADGDGRPTTMAAVHNAYGWLEAKATYEGMVAARPDERPFILSRAAFAGQQRWSAVWTGDSSSTWSTLGMTLPQLLSMGMSGISFGGSDVGGYSGREESTPELFARWMAVGAISPFFRAHAERGARRQEPWAFGDATLAATRSLIGLRYALLPYLYTAFEETSRTGAPVLRPLVFEFQDDERSRTVSDEAMLGPSLLVAPIVTQAAAKSRAVYLPPGRWFELRSGAAYDGARMIALEAGAEPLPLDVLPIFAREGAIVPRFEIADRAFAAAKGPLLLDAFPGASRSSFTLYEDDGAQKPVSAQVMFTLEPAATGTRLEAAPAQGAFVLPHSRVVVRLRRIDHDPTQVTLDGKPLARVATADDVPIGSFAWDANDRAIVVALPTTFPFRLEATHDRALAPDGDVDVPVRVTLPPGTPGDAVVHVASSAAAWAHAPLVRSGDVATGRLRAPRGRFVFFKVTRGGWPTVEKGAGCTELPNRHAFASATERIDIAVAAWADTCP